MTKSVQTSGQNRGRRQQPPSLVMIAVALLLALLWVWSSGIIAAR